MAIISRWLLADVLIMSCAVFAAIYFYFRRFLYTYWKKKGVIYVEPTTPVGNFASVVRGKISIGELYANAYAEQKRNRYFGMYAFHKPSLVIADPDIIREVLAKEFIHFHDRGMYCNEKVDPLTAHLFFLSGSKWRNLRAKLSPTFTSGKIRWMFGNMVDCGDKLTQYLMPKAEKRDAIDMKDLSARFTTDIIMSTIFGITCDSINYPNCEFRYWGRKSAQSRPLINTLLIFAPKVMDFLSIPFTDTGVSTFFANAFKETVSYREANNVKREDFLNLIMQLIRKGYVDGVGDEDNPNIDDTAGKNISLMEGAAQAFVFFIAGFETASSVIAACCYEMACNQDIQDNLIIEIESALKKFGGLTYESLQEMPYLHKVMLETMRKYPPLPLLNRVCTKDINLPTTNLHLSKGLDIVIPILGIHRDPEIYPDPDKFDPERFNSENIAARHPSTYLAFGEGPRICIGKRYSYAEVKVGLISILSKYRVRMGPNTRPLEWISGNILLITKHKIDLIVELR